MIDPTTPTSLTARASYYLTWALPLLLLCSTAALGQPSTAWNATTGNWSNAPSWSSGLPTASTTSTYIDNAGTVQITGSAAAQFVWLGSTATKSGTLEIGAGGVATFTTVVVGGHTGTGTLRVHSGGILNSYGGPIGSDISGVGTALVDGAGSRWQLSGPEMIVGGNGKATLTLSNGGVLTIGGGNGQMGLADNFISEGTLRIGDGGAPGTLNALDVHGHDGKATVVFNHNSSSYTFAPGLYDKLSVEHIGPGRTTLAAAVGTYTGTTKVSGGELIILSELQGSGAMDVEEGGLLGGTGKLGASTTLLDGSIIFPAASIAGVLSPGVDGAGLLTFGGELSLDSTATFVMELAGYVRGSQFDAVNVTTSLEYGGELNIRFLNGFEPRVGDTFRLFAGYTSQSGNFAGITFSKAGFEGSFTPSSGIVTITAVPEPQMMGLVATGLVMWGATRRRRKTSECFSPK